MLLTKVFPAERFALGLSSWQWLDLNGKTPRFSSLFGDVFLEDETGWWYLDRLEGTLTRQWETLEEMSEVLSDAKGQDRYLLGGLAIAAFAQGMALGEGEVYDFMPPPVLGGQTKLENLVTGDFALTLDLSGQIHDQVRKLPPGGRISKIVLEE